MPRIIYFSDTHASKDTTGTRGSVGEWTNKATLNMLGAIDDLKPDYIHHLGDMRDFLIAEKEDVVNQIAQIKSKTSAPIHAIMGNHDYEYYHYQQPFLDLNSSINIGVTPEITAKLVSDANIGDTSLYIGNINDNFVVGEKIVIIESPDYDTSNQFFVSTLNSIDTVNGIITISDTLPSSFIASKNVEIRQGKTVEKGITAFMESVQNTDTKATNHYYKLGNNVFIFLSMGAYYPYDPITNKTNGFTQEDLTWFEDTINKFHQSCNIFVHTHIPPGIETDWGTNFCTMGQPTLCYFSQPTIDTFKRISSSYKIVLWSFGHSHTESRPASGYTVLGQGTSTGWGNTHFYNAPSTLFSGGKEGQIPYFDINIGDTQIKINHYSITNKDIYRTEIVPLIYPVDLPQPVYKFKGFPRYLNQLVNSIERKVSSQFNLYADNIASLKFNLGLLLPNSVNIKEAYLKNELQELGYATVTSKTDYVTLSIDNIVYTNSINSSIDTGQIQKIYIKVDLTEINTVGEIQLEITSGGGI